MPFRLSHSIAEGPGVENVSFQWGVRGTKCLKATMELLIPIIIEMRRGLKGMHWTPEPSSIRRFSGDWADI